MTDEHAYNYKLCTERHTITIPREFKELKERIKRTENRFWTFMILLVSNLGVGLVILLVELSK